MAEGSAPMTEKRDQLASSIKAVLDAHGFGSWIVTEHLPLGLLRSQDRKATLKHMAPDFDANNLASPAEIRYVRIALVSSPEGGGVANSAEGVERFDLHGSIIQASHTFRVMMYYDWSEGVDYASSSQSRFDSLIEADTEGDPIGLLPYLRLKSSLPTSPVSLLSAPHSVALPEYPVALADDSDFVHYMDFLITIT